MEYYLPGSHKGSVTMLNSIGHPFMPPNGCKDYVHDALTHIFYPRYAKLWHITNYGTSKPELNKPGFVVYCGLKSADKNAKKFARFINQIEEMMGIDEKSSTLCTGNGASNDASPFVAIASNFWIRSPVAVSAYLTFLRLSPFMRLGESVDDFVNRQMDKNKSKSQSSTYLRVAVKNGNFTGLLERSLPCLNREGYSDYLLSCHSRGFSVYNRASDEQHPLEEEALVALKITARKNEMERLHVYPYRMQA